MARTLGRNSPTTPGLVNSRSGAAQRARLDAQSADIRFVEVVRPLGNGLALVKNLCNDKVYRVSSPITFAPGTIVPVGSNSGGPGEFVIAQPPAQRAGSSFVGVTVTKRTGGSACPVFITGRNYGSFQQNDLGSTFEVEMARVIGGNIASDPFAQLVSTNFGDNGLFAVIDSSPLVIACMSNEATIGVQPYRAVAWDTSTGAFVLNSERSAATTATGCIVGDPGNGKAWWWEHDAPSTWRVLSLDTSNVVTVEFSVVGLTPPGTPAYYGPQGYIGGSMLCGGFLLAVVRGTNPGVIKFDLGGSTGVYVSAPTLFPADESLWAGEDGWQQGSGITGKSTCVIGGPVTGGGNMAVVEIDANGATVTTLVPASWSVASGQPTRVSPGLAVAEYGMATPTQTFRRVIAAGVDPLGSCTIGWDTPGTSGIWPLCID